MDLTDEQWAIINAPEHILKVNAVAGSGKTTTLLEYAKRRPKQRFLYLTFNKSSSDEMKKKCLVANLDNITVQTFHALAYYYANGRHYELIHDLSEWTIFDAYVKTELDEKRDNLLLVSWLIKDMMVFYLNSSLFYIDETLLARYRNETRPQNQVDRLLSGYAEFILKTIKTILTKMKQCEIPAIHDFYLKMFHLSKPILYYDIILIDEAQDLSGVMLEVLNMQQASRIFVGDTFQQIYAFRYAINALDQIDCIAYALTQTFRFDDALARQISKIVNRGYSILNDRAHFLKIKGRQEKSESLVGERQQIAVISRSVLKLFNEIANYLGGDLTFYFEGGYENYGFMNARVLSVLYLYQGEVDKISDPFIRRFSRFRALRDFAKTSQNRQLLNTCDLVQTYREGLFDLNRKIKQRLVSKEAADVIFTTTHKAKGQEYQSVQMVKEDFITREQLEKAVKKPDDCHFHQLKEEINIFYVAATRARDKISLHKF